MGQGEDGEAGDPHSSGEAGSPPGSPDPNFRALLAKQAGGEVKVARAWTGAAFLGTTASLAAG